MRYMFFLMAFFTLSACSIKVSTGEEATATPAPKIPLTEVVAKVDTQDYTISKYEDEDAVCYTIYKIEAISISCVPKK